MKALRIKDQQNRATYQKYESKRSLLKYLLLQTGGQNTSDFEGTSLGASILSDDWKRRMKALHKIPRNASRTRLRERCVITNRPRSVNKLFKTSRQESRRLALEGKLPGVKRATW